MPLSTGLLIFPHQLFRDHPGLTEGIKKVVLVEDGLFFGDHHHPVQFHQQKLWLHRASMKRYEASLHSKGVVVQYLDHRAGQDMTRQAIAAFAEGGMHEVLVADPHDYLLGRRLQRHADSARVSLSVLETPMFLNSPSENQEYRASKKRWFMADFYKFQRRRLDVLMDGDEPVGGKWSYDEDNRKKVPKAMLESIPAVGQPARDDIDEDAREHVRATYPDHPGRLDQLWYPTSHQQALAWLDEFLLQRFSLFGDYEDAIVRGENWLWHSVLTPMMNIGLLTPAQVLAEVQKHLSHAEVPLNAAEGFVRQVIGWREFMRATYEDCGVAMRTTNHWGHHRPIPESFYLGTTGIGPIDDVIERVNQTGYCHHIERLMILGGFMFLCEFSPDEIYRWFMEMFVDSYDWVMVPNVYAMSQHADGGLITTKPYFSGSSYVKKMSNHPAGEWTRIWDGLYWRWIWNHAEALSKNPRWAMMCSMARKMDTKKRQSHVDVAEAYLQSL